MQHVEMSYNVILDDVGPQSLSGIKLLAELSGQTVQKCSRDIKFNIGAVEFLTRALKAPVHLLMGTLLDLSN